MDAGEGPLQRTLEGHSCKSEIWLASIIFYLIEVGFTRVEVG